MGKKAVNASAVQLQSTTSRASVFGIVIQRVGLNDVDWTNATGVTRSGVGADGVYFVDFADGRLVVKLSSAPVESVDKSQFLGDMGLNAPGSRAVAKGGGEGAQIHTQVQTRLLQARRGEYDGNYADASHFIIMENVPGESFRRVGGAKLREHLSDSNVLIAIGKQAIADAFLGIGDRLLINQNPGNLMVADDGTVYAIDNETHESHPVGNQINAIKTLLDWNGKTTPQYMRDFAQRAALTNLTNAKTVIDLVSTKNARTSIRQGIRTGFDDLVAAARNVPEDNHLHGISEDVIALAEQRTNQSSCYITTACMQHKGLGDNCHQLTVLRDFRDNYMATLPEGKQLISLYYQTAPKIVARIAKRKNRKAIYEYLYEVINECVSMVKNERNEEALSIYCSMVKEISQVLHP